MDLLRWEYSDVAHLADNKHFLATLETIARTNSAEARALWMTLTPIDYRSSNRVSELYPALTAAHPAEVIQFLRSNALLARN